MNQEGHIPAKPYTTDGPCAHVSTRCYTEPHTMEVQCPRCQGIWHADVDVNLSDFESRSPRPEDARNIFNTLSQKPGHDYNDCIQYIAALVRGQIIEAKQPVENENW